MTLALLFLAIINYGFVIKDFNNIGYPRQAIYQYHLFEERGKIDFSYYEEIGNSLSYGDRENWYIDSTGPALIPSGHYTLVNFCFFNHYPDSFIHTYQPFEKSSRDSVVFEKMHFQSHPAYTLEYCTRTGRDFFINKQLKIRVIRLGKDPHGESL